MLGGRWLSPADAVVRQLAKAPDYPRDRHGGNVDEGRTLEVLAWLRRYLPPLVLVPALVVAVLVALAMRATILNGAGSLVLNGVNGFAFEAFQGRPLESAEPSEVAALDRSIQTRLESGTLRAFTLLDLNGRVIYSTDEARVGESVTIGARERAALQGRMTVRMAPGLVGPEPVMDVVGPVTVSPGARPAGILIAERYATPVARSVHSSMLAVVAVVLIGAVSSVFIQRWVLNRAERAIEESDDVAALAAERLRASLADLETHSLGTLQALNSAVDAKDSYTALHSVNVADYAVAIVRELGVDLDERVVERAGLLHDIGKIGLSEVVLQKPARLSEDEMQQVREHSRMGARIIESIPFLADVVPAVMHHHERWDGTGYPDGLANEAIPLAARVLAVADAFDAMTTERTYSRARTLAEAVAEIRAGSGRQFDPVCADALLSAIDRGTVTPRAHVSAFGRRLKSTGAA